MTSWTCGFTRHQQGGAVLSTPKGECPLCNLLAWAVQVIRGSGGLSLTFCCPLCWKGVRHFCSDGLSSGPLVWAASLASLAGVVASDLLRVGLEVVAEAASFICQVQTYPSVGCSPRRAGSQLFAWQ